MEYVKNEGIKRQNNIPLPIQCLIMPSWEESNWVYSHYHEYIELLYVLEGEYEVLLEGEITHLPEKSMFVVQAGEAHETRQLGKKQTLLCIKFLPQILYSSEQSVTELEYSIPYVFENFSKCRKFDAAVLKDTFIPQVFEEICQEKKAEKFGYELALRSHVLRIFLWLMRYWHERAGDLQLTMPNRKVAVLLQKTREYVKECYQTVTLSEVAQKCGVSYGYFSRVFNQYMKMSFSDYVNRERINHSLKLLTFTDLSITEVALTVGFSTTSYYIQMFKKYKSISPNRFRKMFGKMEENMTVHETNLEK